MPQFSQTILDLNRLGDSVNYPTILYYTLKQAMVTIHLYISWQRVENLSVVIELNGPSGPYANNGEGLQRLRTLLYTKEDWDPRDNQPSFLLTSSCILQQPLVSDSRPVYTLVARLMSV